MTTTSAEHAMRLAIEASQAALDQGNAPYGATLAAPDGRVLMVAQNNEVTSGDCTGHAEMVLVRRAQSELGSGALRGSTVYASGEPCPMCAGAMFWAGVDHVVFAVSQQQLVDALGGDQALPVSSAELLAAGTPQVRVTAGLLADEALAVLTRGKT